jgi:hypothetical protein
MVVNLASSRVICSTWRSASDDMRLGDVHRPGLLLVRLGNMTSIAGKGWSGI